MSIINYSVITSQNGVGCHLEPIGITDHEHLQHRTHDVTNVQISISRSSLPALGSRRQYAADVHLSWRLSLSDPCRPVKLQQEGFALWSLQSGGTI